MGVRLNLVRILTSSWCAFLATGIRGERGLQIYHEYIQRVFFSMKEFFDIPAFFCSVTARG